MMLLVLITLLYNSNIDHAPAYYNRGLAKEQLGQLWEAEQDWRTALKLATQADNVELKKPC